LTQGVNLNLNATVDVDLFDPKWSSWAEGNHSLVDVTVSSGVQVHVHVKVNVNDPQPTDAV
jgi:hypothetical protein